MIIEVLVNWLIDTKILYRTCNRKLLSKKKIWPALTYLNFEIPFVLGIVIPLLFTDADQLPRYIQLCDILNSTPIGKLLETVQNDEGVGLAEKYITDYVRSARRLLPNQHDKLIKVPVHTVAGT